MVLPALQHEHRLIKTAAAERHERRGGRCDGQAGFTPQRENRRWRSICDGHFDDKRLVYKHRGGMRLQSDGGHDAGYIHICTGHDALVAACRWLRSDDNEHEGDNKWLVGGRGAKT